MSSLEGIRALSAATADIAAAAEVCDDEGDAGATLDGIQNGLWQATQTLRDAVNKTDLPASMTAAEVSEWSSKFHPVATTPSSRKLMEQAITDAAKTVFENTDVDGGSDSFRSLVISRLKAAWNAVEDASS